jgi:DNA-binding response OmpR family regulator
MWKRFHMKAAGAAGLGACLCASLGLACRVISPGALRGFFPVRDSRILVVDDDAEMQELVAWTLRREGWQVESALTAAEAARLLMHNRPDLVVLDVMLPDGNGLDLLGQWRALYPDMAILMLSALGESPDRVRGLDRGADDYLPKPFEKAELVSRLRALLRRRQQLVRLSSSEFVGLGLRLDRVRREVTLNGQRLVLTDAEFKLLEALLRDPVAVLSRETLNAAVQSGAYRPQDRTVDTQIYRLRGKLRAADPQGQWISTARGQGYALVSSQPSESI